MLLSHIRRVNKYFLTSGKFYSTVIQETRAEAALIEEQEEMFKDHLINLTRELRKEKKDLMASFSDRDILPKDKVGHSENSLVFKKANNKPTKDYSLGLIFPGDCFKLKKDIQNIFKEELTKAAILHKASKIASKPRPMSHSSKMKRNWVQLSQKANCQL